MKRVVEVGREGGWKVKVDGCRLRRGEEGSVAELSPSFFLYSPKGSGTSRRVGECIEKPSLPT